tara:strand:+ start:1371 stop:2360 length:990 start_codon:yes stop_codon:yes gene_type:complete
MDLHSDYQKHFPLAERFRKAVVEEIVELIGKNDISLGVPIESRVKAASSIENKLSNKETSVDSVLDLDDFIGIRLILLFKSDLKKVCEILASNFKLLDIEDTSMRLNESEFGYQSNHLIVSMPDSWLTVPSLADFECARAEIQVRTVAQHIWAAASHKLQYKKELSVPATLRRSLHRVSALLETVDLEFERLLSQRQNYLENEIDKVLGTDSLNVDILEKLCDQLLPSANKLENEEGFSEVLGELIHFKIDTPNKLEKLVQDHLKTVLIEDSERAETENFEDQVEYERANRGVFYTFVGLLRGLLLQEFGKEYNDYREKLRFDEIEWKT